MRTRPSRPAAVIAWFFLEESLTLSQVLGMGLAAAGALLVQVPGRVAREWAAIEVGDR